MTAAPFIRWSIPEVYPVIATMYVQAVDELVALINGISFAFRLPLANPAVTLCYTELQDLLIIGSSARERRRRPRTVMALRSEDDHEYQRSNTAETFCQGI